MQGDLNATETKVNNALDAFEKTYPNEHIIDEYRKLYREAGNDFARKVLAAANNERAKKVSYEEYIHILGRVLQEVDEAERRLSQDSFFSARSQQQQDEGTELTDLSKKV